MTTQIDTLTPEVTVADAILETDGAATELGVSMPTLMELIHSGELRAARIGIGRRRFRIRRSWIFDYLDRASELGPCAAPPP
jgi:excisionase family DNA binding protein